MHQHCVNKLRNVDLTRSSRVRRCRCVAVYWWLFRWWFYQTSVAFLRIV